MRLSKKLLIVIILIFLISLVLVSVYVDSIII